MKQDKASITALLGAWLRAKHYADVEPKIFEDHVAHLILAPDCERLEALYISATKELFPDIAASCPDDMTFLKNMMQESAAVAEVLSRARYAEDKLADAVTDGIGQYVLIGAGMDTFAFRCPKTMEHLEIFEVDHPTTQTFKLQRLHEGDLTLPPNVHFIGADLTEVNLATALSTSPFRQEYPAFFSWLGMVMYIPREKVFATLQAIRNIAAAGSQLVFDYYDTDAFDPNKVTPRVQALMDFVRRRGEPFISSFDPNELEAALSQMGLHQREHLNPQEIGKKYFHGRADGYRACEHAHFFHAVVE